MPLELLTALIIVLPIIILLAIFVWYLNFGRIYATIKEEHQKRESLAGSKKLETGRDLELIPESADKETFRVSV